jgi:hypothetical protein
MSNNSNIQNDIHNYTERIHQLEQTLIKQKTHIQKMEMTNKRLHEIISKHGLNVNNTSIGFFLPSEFKNLWEKLIKTELPDALEFYIDDPILLANISQDIFNIIYNITSQMINLKVNTILNSLNINVTNTEEQRQMLTRFIPFFQEHFAKILHLDEHTLQIIKSQIADTTMEYDFAWKKENLQNEMQKQEFNCMLNTFFCIVSYMLLHEPALTVDVVPFKERKLKFMFYNKKSADIIDGFANEDMPCVIILQPPLLRGQFAFKGMKPAVCTLGNKVDENILEECELNKKMFNNYSKSTNNTPILSKGNIEGVVMNEPWKSSQKPQSNTFRVMNGIGKGSFDNKKEAKKVLEKTLPKKKLKLEIPCDEDNTTSKEEMKVSNNNDNSNTNKEKNNISVNNGNNFVLKTKKNKKENVSMDNKALKHKVLLQNQIKNNNNNNNIHNNKEFHFKINNYNEQNYSHINNNNIHKAIPPSMPMKKTIPNNSFSLYINKNPNTTTFPKEHTFIPSSATKTKQHYNLFNHNEHPYISCDYSRQYTNEKYFKVNETKPPIASLKQISLSYRNTQRSEPNQRDNKIGLHLFMKRTFNSNFKSNNFMANEIKINELKKKYQIETSIENEKTNEIPKHTERENYKSFIKHFQHMI